jgi:hypothetical protein
MDDTIIYALYILTLMNTAMITTLQVNGGPIRRRLKKGEAPPPKAVCEGCDHNLSFHDINTHACHEQVQGAPIKYDNDHNPTAHGLRQCTCRMYVGHVPYDRIIAAYNPTPLSPPPASPDQEGTR